MDFNDFDKSVEEKSVKKEKTKNEANKAAEAKANTQAKVKKEAKAKTRSTDNVSKENYGSKTTSINNTDNHHKLAYERFGASTGSRTRYSTISPHRGCAASRHR